MSLGLAGLFQDAGLPLFYEALAEIMFPLPESLSASILVQWSSIISLLLLFIAPNRGKLVNLIVLVTSGLSMVMISCARFTYKRRDEDERIQSIKRTLNHPEDNIINETLSNDIV